MARCWARARYCLLTLAAGSLSLFGGCGLSDQQWASIWESVITTGLNTIVSNALNSALAAAGQA